MSRSAVSACLEGIDRVGQRGANERLEIFLAHDVDRAVEQARDILFYRDIFEYADICFGLDFDHDVDIAAGTIIAARHRSEQRGATHAAHAQAAFVLSQDRKGVVCIHGDSIAHPAQAPSTPADEMPASMARQPSSLYDAAP